VPFGYQTTPPSIRTKNSVSDLLIMPKTVSYGTSELIFLVTNMATESETCTELKEEIHGLLQKPIKS